MIMTNISSVPFGNLNVYGLKNVFDFGIFHKTVLFFNIHIFVIGLEFNFEKHRKPKHQKGTKKFPKSSKGTKKAKKNFF